MRVNKLILAESVQRLGVPGVIGVGLVVLALAALLSAVMPAQQELERGRLAQQRLAEQKARLQAGGEQKPQTPEEQLKAFYGRFPAETDAADALQKVYDAASQNAVTLPHGEYNMAVDEKANLARYRITLPVRGSYQQIRGFIAAALAAVPTLALDHVDFQRQKIGDPQLEAKVRMTLFLTRK